VLFDYGHTLVDFRRTQEALHAAYERVRGRIEAAAYLEVPEILDLIERVAGGVDRIVSESYRQRRMEELDMVELFTQTLAGVGFDLPADVVAHIVEADHSAYSNSIVVEPEVLEVLDGLRADGYRTGIVSNVALLPHLMRGDLERMGIAGLMDAAVFSSETRVRKPDPRIFQEALARLGSDPGETVFVGDRLFDDVGGAQAVGMRAVQSTQFREEADPEAAPDAVIGQLGELPDLLRSWGGPPGGPGRPEVRPPDPSRTGASEGRGSSSGTGPAPPPARRRSTPREG
jgi:putative hydrolase of the HAD superfamily